ncbi:Acyl-CoA dehydrogenase [Saccharopolyspora antimicrobica]|uniref:Acyl-CoA dehydrogenase n=1 Tax=Saccharopolyspora antimicrobica TaxID=455193 RepID=A0A1I5FGC0_9PSEU|nr:acyl-CoA dehydrogenase family protein [Saccharopolyspora antimicrobica]RKT82139.1 alkylation response protein AidB-like acyl-CoA dehydrogenase [Saccharopolyspora antimicrobica]SFO22795.1 Acyl-CoA dehydrogenase [Saccharopolyspora antimicrobica]
MEPTDHSGTTPDRVSHLLEFLRRYSRQRLDSRRMDERRAFPTSLIPDLAAHGLFGLQIAEEHGGLGLSHSDFLRVITQLGAIDANLFVLLGVHNTLGVPPVAHYAAEHVKNAVLPDVAQGRALITSAISEPGAGSNVRAVQARAERWPDGSYVINGSKQWISLGADATYVNVFARLSDEYGRDLGITGFLVDTSTPGFVGGPEVLTLGLKAVPQNSLEFQSLRVPGDALLGGEGAGLLAAKEAFMRGRVTLAAGGLGAMMRSLELAERFARRRQVATGNLAENGRIHQLFAESVAATQAVEALVHYIGARMDSGEHVPEELFFAAKITGCELMWQVVDRSVQLLGARGYVDTNVLGQFFRDYRLLRIFEGSTEAITVYLGSRMLAAPQRVLSLLDEFDVAPHLQELAAGVAKLASAKTANVQSQHVLANVVGELTCWTIMAGLTGQSQHRSEMAQYTAAWCEQQLSERLRTAEQGTPFVELPTVDAIARHIGSYDDTIGDVEQRRPGDQNDLDLLLRRH